MNKLLCLLIAPVVALGLQVTAARQVGAQGEKLLAAAQHRATVDGDLKGAIEEYGKIVAGAGPNRALAAQALVLMADCYQKLGDAESRTIYERVVKEYADQTEAASVARARLGRIKSAAGEAGIVTRQVWTGPKVDLWGTVSADGRFVSFADWSTGNVALHDLSAGTDRPLTGRRTGLDSPFEMAERSAVSPDGKLVAYAWWGPTGRYDLRVVGTDGTAPATPRVLHADDTIESIDPYAWSPDGRWLAVQFRRTDGTGCIGLVSARDGGLRALKSTDRSQSTRLFYSPDGKHLAFDLPASEKSAARDVFVLAVDGSGEIPAVVNPGNDVAIGWTPNGRHLLFASDRGGSRGLWALPWAQGKPQGEPQLIKTDINLDAPLGVTRAGVLYYGVTLSRRDVYVAELDAVSGKILSPPVRPIEQFVGANSSPDWSPDGRSLAYISRSTVLAIRAMDTGQTRELRPALRTFYSPRWAPNGLSFAVDGIDDKGRRGVYRVDAQTGDTSPIVQVPPGHSLWALSWLPDGKKLVYRDTPRDGDTVVVEHDVESGSKRELLRGRIATLSLSPDGQSLAFVGGTGSLRPRMVVPIAGGQAREVRTQNVQGPIMVIAWTPDGRSILYQTVTENDEPGDMYLVSPDGGPSRRVDLKLHTGGPPLRFNPHTNQIAVTADTSRREVWVMEHFLPALKVP